MRRWRLLQLADSAFPTGSYAHSAGLEAFPATDSALYFALEQALVSARRQALPFVYAAWNFANADDPSEICKNIEDLDDACDAMLTGAVANRASRNQGRALLVAATEALEGEPSARSESLRALAKAQGGRPFANASKNGNGVASDGGPLTQRLRDGVHLPVAFGAVFGSLAASIEETEELYLFGLVRTVVSAAVRLNRIGPFAGQRLQDRAGNRAAQILAQPRVPLHEAASASPFLDLMQEIHPTLQTKLFQS